MELIYARWQGWCTAISLATLAGAFLAYLAGAGEPLVPLERLAGLWHLPADEFVAATGAPVGWGWLARLGRSDYLNMLGVAMLCLVTAVCYLRIVVYRGGRMVRLLAIAQVLVLLAAASGLFAAGH